LLVLAPRPATNFLLCRSSVIKSAKNIPNRDGWIASASDTRRMPGIHPFAMYSSIFPCDRSFPHRWGGNRPVSVPALDAKPVRADAKLSRAGGGPRLPVPRRAFANQGPIHDHLFAPGLGHPCPDAHRPATDHWLRPFWRPALWRQCYQRRPPPAEPAMPEIVSVPRFMHPPSEEQKKRMFGFPVYGSNRPRSLRRRLCSRVLPNDPDQRRFRRESERNWSAQ